MTSFFVEYTVEGLPARARVDLFTAEGEPVPVEAHCVPPTRPQWQVGSQPLPQELADKITDRARGLGVPNV